MNSKQVLEALSVRDLLEPAKAIAGRHHISLEEMFGRSRVRPAPKARAEFYTYLKRDLGWSYPRIGSLVDRDHTTVMNQVRGVELQIGDAPILRTRVA